MAATLVVGWHRHQEEKHAHSPRWGRPDKARPSARDVSAIKSRSVRTLACHHCLRTGWRPRQGCSHSPTPPSRGGEADEAVGYAKPYGSPLAHCPAAPDCRARRAPHHGGCPAADHSPPTRPVTATPGRRWRAANATHGPAERRHLHPIGWPSNAPPPRPKQPQPLGRINRIASGARAPVRPAPLWRTARPTNGGVAEGGRRLERGQPRACAVTWRGAARPPGRALPGTSGRREDTRRPHHAHERRCRQQQP